MPKRIYNILALAEDHGHSTVPRDDFDFRKGMLDGQGQIPKTVVVLRIGQRIAQYLGKTVRFIKGRQDRPDSLKILFCHQFGQVITAYPAIFLT